jgi:4-hydroxy-tetrahydrodipicolinate synthase
MKYELARGIVVPCLTIFCDDTAQTLDVLATADHVDWLIKQGASGIVVGGSSGEFTALERWEFLRLLDGILEVAADRVPIYASTGRYSTRETIELSLRAKDAGAAGAMVVLPYYMHPPIMDVLAHFRELRSRVGADFPIILYNNPGTCGYELSTSVIVGLHRDGTINAVKASQGPADAAFELQRWPFAPIVYYGHDYDAWRAARSQTTNGPLHGWLSGILNVFPEAACRTWSGSEDANEAWQRISPLAHHIWIRHEFHPVTAYKAALKIFGRNVGVPRRPLREPTLDAMHALEAILEVV